MRLLILIYTETFSLKLLLKFNIEYAVNIVKGFSESVDLVLCSMWLCG